LKGGITVDQSDKSPTVLVSSSGWTLAGEGTIRSEDRVAWNLKASRAGEISLLEKHQIVPIEGKKRVWNDGMRSTLSSIEECVVENSGG